MSHQDSIVRPRSLTTAIIVIAAGLAAGCEVGRDFRAAAGPAVQSGVTEIVNGLLDGLFAAIEVEPENE